MFGAEHLTAPGRRWTAWMLGLSVAGAAAVLAVILFALNCFGDHNDFPVELWPAYVNLWQRHVAAAWHATPAYVLAAVWRLPFALVGLAFGAGWRADFLLTAIPCLIAPGVFGIWFSGRVAPESADRRRRIQIGFALFGIVDPVAWYACLLGHPEEIVGICLMIAAVLMAAEGRLGWAIALTVMGLLNKPGLGEVAPALSAVAAIPLRYRRATLLVFLAATTLYFLTTAGPLTYGLNLPFTHEDNTLAGGSFPFDLFWWFGQHSWFIRYAHLVIPILAVLLCLAWSELRERRAHNGIRDALWLIALLMMLRTALEPGNNTYYNLPFVFAVFCLDSAPARPPWRTVAATVSVLLLVPQNRILPLGQNAQAALFTAVTVPVLAALAARVFAGTGIGRSLGPVPWGDQRSGKLSRTVSATES